MCQFQLSILFLAMMESATVVGGRAFNPLTFASQKVATLVDDGNFLAWKQHVLLVVRTHGLRV